MEIKGNSVCVFYKRDELVLAITIVSTIHDFPGVGMAAPFCLTPQNSCEVLREVPGSAGTAPRQLMPSTDPILGGHIKPKLSHKSISSPASLRPNDNLSI